MDNVESIFYKKQRFNYYELFSHTLYGGSGKLRTIYKVAWHTMKGTIEDELTKEEYEVLLNNLVLEIEGKGNKK